jgi:hypothetical protein
MEHLGEIDAEAATKSTYTHKRSIVINRDRYQKEHKLLLFRKANISKENIAEN